MPDEQALGTAGPGHQSGTDVFADVQPEALLANGLEIRVAPATPADLDAVRAFYDSLSDTAAYYRFLGMRPALIDEELRHTVLQDVPRHVTLLAWLEQRLIGIGEFVTTDDPDEAELALAVADDHHHEGVATLLLERLVTVARRCGLRHFVAKTLRGNEEMKLVLRTLGLSERIEVEDGMITFTLDLATYDHMQRQAAVRLEHALRAASQHQHDAPRPGDVT